MKPNGMQCELCTEKCPQAARAHEAAAGRMYATKEFITLQKKIESGQLVEVVRCKDCKYYYHYGGTSLLAVKAGWCKRRTRYDEDIRMLQDDFCSYGKRKYEDG